jgi:hypothetical protein
MRKVGATGLQGEGSAIDKKSHLSPLVQVSVDKTAADLSNLGLKVEMKQGCDLL